MVFLVLLSYSLPNGTVQTSDSGFIVREKTFRRQRLQISARIEIKFLTSCDKKEISLMETVVI